MSGRINKVTVDIMLAGIRQCAPHALPGPELLGELDGDDESVPLAPYRLVLEEVYRRAGGVALLEAGRWLERAVHPILFVLLNSDSPGLLLEKEARLQRFIHSRHMLRVIAERQNGISIEHVSSADEPPATTENLAACGLYLVLIEQIGCLGLRLRFPDSAAPERWVYRDRRYCEPAAGGGYQRWIFEWDELRPTRRPMAGLDEVLLAQAQLSELADLPATVAAVERVLRRDLGRTWSVAEVADQLGTSIRSLQRSLAREDTRFSAEVDRVRVNEAQRLLKQSRLSVTEIGYVCGFADAAHFSRRFKKRLGCSPSAYRDELCREPNTNNI